MTTPRLVSSCGQHAGDDAAPEVRAPAFTRTGADVQRADRARRFAAALHGALADTCGAAGLARALGASETLVRDWASVDHERQMPAHDFLALPADVAAALAIRTGAAPTVPPSPSPESAHRRLSALVGAPLGAPAVVGRAESFVHGPAGVLPPSHGAGAAHVQVVPGGPRGRHVSGGAR